MFKLVLRQTDRQHLDWGAPPGSNMESLEHRPEPTLKGISRQLPALDALANKLLDKDCPPWREYSSRYIAEALGVSLQSLANWRVRGSGPPALGHIRKRGNRIYYRLEDVIAWLLLHSGHPIEPWEASAMWLERRGLSCNVRTEYSTRLLERAYE